MSCRDDTLLIFNKSYFYLKKKKINCFINKILDHAVMRVFIL